MGDLQKALIGVAAASSATAGGGEAVRGGRATDRSLAVAANALDELELDEATAVADLLRKDSLAAHVLVTQQYGSWPEMWKRLRQRSDLMTQARALEEALGQLPPSPDANVRARQAATLEALQRGIPPLGSDIMGTLFPKRATNVAALGLDPADWTAESLNRMMEEQNLTGVVDYTLLVPRFGAGKVPETMNLPSGYQYDPRTGAVSAIPGTKAETDAEFARIMREMLAEGQAGAPAGLDEYLKRHPENKAFYQAYLRQNFGGLGALMADLLEQRWKGGAPAGPAGEPSPEARALAGEGID